MEEGNKKQLGNVIIKIGSKQKLTEKDLKLMIKSFMENILFLHHEVNLLKS